MLSFRALQFSNQEIFRTLKYYFMALDFNVRNFSNLESLRALKLSEIYIEKKLKTWKGYFTPKSICMPKL